MLKIADTLEIEPTHAVGQRIAVVGKSNSGKTNTLRIWAREWMTAGWPVVILDPMNQFALMHSISPVIIAGRRKDVRDDNGVLVRKGADLEITPDNAVRLAEVCFEQRISLVLEMSLYDPEEEFELLEAFLKRFWQLVLRQDDAQPFGLIVDEAQNYVPQGEKTTISSTIIDMAKRGRHMNLTTVIASQRPASIDKNFLTQATLIVAHRLSLGVDTVALAETVSISKKELTGMMRKLHTGEALLIGDPVFTGEDDYLMVTVHLYEGAVAGLEAQVHTGEAAQIDLAALLELIGSEQPDDGGDAEALLSEIKELRETIRLLRGQIATLQSENREPREGQAVGVLPTTAMPELEINGHWPNNVAGEWVESAQTETTGADIPYDPNARNIALNTGQERILRAIVRHHPMKFTRAQVATLADYTASGGAFSGNFGTLKRHSLIDETNSEVTATRLAFAYLNEPLPLQLKSPEYLFGMWMSVLPTGAARLMGTLENCRGHWISRSDLAVSSGYTPTGGAFGEALGHLRRNGLVEEANRNFRPAPMLMREEWKHG